MISAKLVPVPRDHREAKQSALVRDGFRCVVTKMYERRSVEESKELMAQATREVSAIKPHPASGLTRCAHILSESTNLDNSLRPHYATSVWAVLECFGFRDIIGELDGPGVHRLQNVLTLPATVLDRFDELKIWFEETDIEHHYSIGAAHPQEAFVLGCLPKKVTFKIEHKELPLPSPIYLKLHGVCAKVAYLSGAGKYIEKVQRDLERTDVMASDGSTAELLHDALSWVQPYLGT